MANYYTNFSERLNTTDEYASWILNEIEVNAEEHKMDNGDSWPDFECKVEVVGSLTDPNVIIYFMHMPDGSGSMDQVVSLVAAAFKKFNIPGSWSITAVFGCGRPRPGEFSSCVAVVSRSGVKWLSSSKWVEDQESLIEMRQKK